MKQLFILIVILLSSTSLFGQDTEPTAWNFLWDSAGTGGAATPFVPDSFQQQSIITGFQYSGSWGMNIQIVFLFS